MDSQLRTGKAHKVAGIHIDELRPKKALLNPSKFSGYLRGRQELVRYRSITERKMFDKYRGSRNKLTALVFDDVDVAFVTCTSRRNRALLAPKKKKTGEKRTKGPTEGEEEPEYEPWRATTCIMDEAGCANPLHFMTPMTTVSPTLRRYVLAGDHLQLPPYCSSQDVLKYWPKSALHDLLEVKKVDTALLNTQYRSHGKLFAAADELIYKNKVNSRYKTEEPRLFLTNLQRNLPTRIYTDQNMGELTTYSNFVNVNYGEEESRYQGSSRNLAEVSVIKGMVRALIDKKCPRGGIAILTGYLWQLESLEKMVQSHDDWKGVKVLNADRCQGREYEIVIISLVKTREPPGSIGDRFRSNVIVTRSREARFFVGNWAFWSRPAKLDSNFETMHRLIQHMHYNSGKEPFCVNMKDRK